MDMDTGDPHILHITIAPSSVITYFEIANKQKTTKCKLPIANYKLQIANYKLQIANCQSDMEMILALLGT